MLVPMEPATTFLFATTARALAAEARQRGLAVPGFRSPPRVAGVDRTLRRRGASATVAIRVRGRPWPLVLDDMIEGVVAANDLGPEAAADLRVALRAAADTQRSGLRTPPESRVA